MDAAGLALWLLSTGTDLLAKGKDLWVSAGKDPADFDAAVSAAREAREELIDAQRAAELAVLGGR